jgi:molecular chaperone DnaK
MVRDAESHADDDRRKKEVVETKNHAENLVYSTRKSLKDIGDKVDAGTRDTIEQAAKELEDALKGDDVELIKRKMEELQEAAYKLSEAAYQQASHTNGGGGGGGYGGEGGEGGSEDEVVQDAEYEVIDEEK